MVFEQGLKIEFILDKRIYEIKKVYKEEIKIKNQDGEVFITENWVADIKGTDGIIIEKISIELLKTI